MDMAMAGGMEDAENFGKMDMLAEKHLAQGGVIGDADYIAGDLDGEMEIANEPAKARALGRGGERELQNWLGLLGDDVSRATGGEEGCAVVEGLGEIEAELAGVLGGGVPAALCEGVAVCSEGDCDGAAVRGGEGGADDVHGGNMRRRPVSSSDYLNLHFNLNLNPFANHCVKVQVKVKVQVGGGFAAFQRVQAKVKVQVAGRGAA